MTTMERRKRMMITASFRLINVQLGLLVQLCIVYIQLLANCSSEVFQVMDIYSFSCLLETRV